MAPAAVATGDYDENGDASEDEGESDVEEEQEVAPVHSPLPQEEGWEVVSNKVREHKEKAPASTSGEWTHVWGTPPAKVSTESKGERMKREADKKLKTTQRQNERRRSKKDAVLEAQRQAIRDRS
jgi:hypothetical protein